MFTSSNTIILFPSSQTTHSNLFLHRWITLLTCSQLLLDSYHIGKSEDSVLGVAPQFVSWVNNITLSADEDTFIKLITYIIIIRIYIYIYIYILGSFYIHDCVSNFPLVIRKISLVIGARQSKI